MSLPPLVALEIGTSKVCALVGEDREDGQIMITGVGECPSRGVRKSEIIEPTNATACVKAALQAAEESAQVTINQVHLLISGGHIQNLVNRGTVPIVNDHHEVTADDIDHCMEAARVVSLSADREILHTIYQTFAVDDQSGVVNPEGMEASQLAVECLIVHGVRNRLRNTVKVVKSVPMEVETVAFSGLCSALAVLTPTDKENGVALIDIGGGTTDYVVYAGNAIASAGAIAVGGDHLSNDIAWGLRIPLLQAERLKEEAGSVQVNAAARSQRIPLPPEPGAGPRHVRHSDLNTIMHLRMEELLGLIRHELESKDLLKQLGGGVVFTGGGARIRGLLELGEKVFRLPCAIGRPKNISGLTSATDGPQYAAPVGMLRYGIQSARRRRPPSRLGRWISRILGAA
jgi:cell division protein FtsA